MDPKGTKPATEAMGMPPMMQQMMQKMMGGIEELNPMTMCRAMLTSITKSAEMAAYATPEVRTLFEEWAQSVESEILDLLKGKGPLDLKQLAGHLKVSPESTLYFLGKLVREEKVTISGVQATPGESRPM